MAEVTIGFGVALVVLGIGGYTLSGAVSVTALIPAAVGVVLVALGALALKEQFRKHAMHAAAAVGLIGFLGSAGALPALVTMMSGGTVERPAAIVARSVMAGLTSVFVGLCIKSFIDARRRRTAATRP